MEHRIEREQKGVIDFDVDSKSSPDLIHTIGATPIRNAEENNR